MSQCPQFDCARPDEINLPLTPYPDISGRGVIIGFVGTAYFVVVLQLLNYLIAHDPESCPFQDEGPISQALGQAFVGADSWRPNPIDVAFLGRFRRLVFLITRTKLSTTRGGPRHRHIARAFDLCIRSLCDTQLMTGFAILIGGFSVADCGLSSYHWQILVCQAWFACVTHLAGLTAVRRYLHSHPLEKFVRWALSIALMGTLLAAIVPTAFFDWRVWDNGTLLATESTPATCFFDLMGQRDYYNKKAAEYCKSYTGNYCYSESLEGTHALQTVAFTMGLLILSLCSCTVRLFTSLQFPIKKKMDSMMNRPRLRHADQVSSKTKDSPTEILLEALYMAFSLNFDLFNSILAEVYWLVVLLVWGTIRLAGSLVTDDEAVSKAEAEWTFGQLLPVILLIAPILSSIWSFVGDKNDVQHKTSLSGERQRAYQSEVTLSPSVVGTKKALDAGQPALETLRLDTLSASGSSLSSPPVNHQPTSIDMITSSPVSKSREAACYSGLDWLVPYLAIIWATIMVYTASSIILTQGGPDFGPGFKPVNVWFSAQGIFFALLLVYPASCVSAMFVGLYVDYNGSKGSTTWSFGGKLVFWIFGTVIQLFSLQLNFAARPFLAAAAAILLVLLLYGLALLRNSFRPARARSIGL
ncbi:hypothetical protein GGS20DRAFT_590530 [Poronia punctata]|nr:hypothetical protein GGS20DRAFT_590530 [Poronia punctata]